MTSVTGLRHGDSLRLLERGAVVNQQEMGQIGTREDSGRTGAFGRPIGSFQAIQHHCANMLVDVETARYLTCQEVSKAKAWTSDAHRLVTALAHQCHGAIGFIKEMDVHLSHNRAKVSELLFDGSAFHLEG